MRPDGCGLNSADSNPDFSLYLQGCGDGKNGAYDGTSNMKVTIPSENACGRLRATTCTDLSIANDVALPLLMMV